MNHTTVSLEELFFYIYFIIMTVAKGLGLVDGMIYKACLLTAMFFVILKLLVGKYSIAEYVIIASLLLLCLYIWHVTGNMSFFICVTLVVSLKNVPVRRVFNVGAFVWTFAFMI